jgi:hypothetical protein
MSEIVETKILNRRLIWILLLVNLSVPAFVFFQRDDNNLSDTATIWVGWLSALMMTTMLGIEVYRRRRAANRNFPRGIIWTSIGLVILSGLITTIAISSNPSDNYLQVALSDTPLSKIHPERKRLLVELIRRNAANSAENRRLAKTLTPISPALYSVDSFASKAAMESTSSQLKQEYDIDQTYATAMHQSMRQFHNQMQKVDPAYLRGFEAIRHDDDVLEDSIADAEARWVTSALDLYQYAIAHAGEISETNDGHLAIAPPDVRQILLQQIGTSKALQQMMLDYRARAVIKQQVLQDAAGIKHSD